jgi:hypothetical protein
VLQTLVQQEWNVYTKNQWWLALARSRLGGQSLGLVGIALLRNLPSSTNQWLRIGELLKEFWDGVNYQWSACLCWERSGAFLEFMLWLVRYGPDNLPPERSSGSSRHGMVAVGLPSERSGVLPVSKIFTLLVVYRVCFAAVNKLLLKYNVGATPRMQLWWEAHPTTQFFSFGCDESHDLACRRATNAA